MTENNAKPWRMLAIIFLVIALLVLAGAGYLVLNRSGQKPDGYQGVFLTNGQVYFGKITSQDDRYIRLTDIYYLKTQTQGQQTDLNQPNFNLVKLGSEPHGPKDEMYISRNQVLFWENLKADGKVVQAIEKSKSGQ